MSAVTDEAPLEQRLLVLAPTGRDGALTRTLLVRAGLAAEVCPDMAALCVEAERGAAGLLVADETLTPAGVRRLVALLARQPPWSDLPIVVFAGQRVATPAREPPGGVLASLGNVTLLDRPVRPETMLSAARAALRARRRQYDAREELVRQQQAVRQRDQFLAMLGHELRNPLGVILLAAEMLEMGAQADRQSEIIRRQGRHLARLVDDLLDVSRVTTGKVILQRQPVDVVAVVARCVQSARPALDAQRLRLSFDEGRAPLLVDGDPVRLEQVFVNLVTNAIKYTPPGGAVAVRVEREGEAAVVRVRDTGVGIAREMLPRIFDLFTQVAGTLDRSQGGLGIGLTLVRSLVELHSGTVEAHSEGAGRGSEFVVRLPLAVASRDAPTTTADEAGAGPGRRVLLIEDNPDTRELLTLLLEARGHEVHAAADGPQGVERALALSPDALIIDIGLPGLDGYGVARRLRAHFGGRVLLVALTGYGQPEDERRALDAGFDAHCTKPVDPARLDRLLAASPSN